mmetsp:Transcript_42597/g.78745  ORF Transcript_42597/g.78745 Transcript_42597/m.78745 type:complete len:249 (-) Transcript_42597:306-1052(-)
MHNYCRHLALQIDSPLDFSHAALLYEAASPPGNKIPASVLFSLCFRLRPSSSSPSSSKSGSSWDEGVAIGEVGGFDELGTDDADGRSDGWEECVGGWDRVGLLVGAAVEVGAVEVEGRAEPLRDGLSDWLGTTLGCRDIVGAALTVGEREGSAEFLTDGIDDWLGAMVGCGDTVGTSLIVGKVDGSNECFIEGVDDRLGVTVGWAERVGAALAVGDAVRESVILDDIEGNVLSFSVTFVPVLLNMLST